MEDRKTSDNRQKEGNVKGYSRGRDKINSRKVCNLRQGAVSES